MKLKGNIKSLRLSFALFSIAVVAILLLSCVNHQSIRTNCSDESIVAATIYHLRTGHETFIAKSKDGSHAQAYAMVNGKRVWLRMYPRFMWGVDTWEYHDDFVGGIGYTYKVDSFIKKHRFK